MFNLEQSIAAWRRQLQTAGIQSPEHLDELEGHLREEIDAQLQTGTNAETAFTRAVQSLGQPDSIRREFVKARPTVARWLERSKAAFFKLFGRPLPTPCPLSSGAEASLELGRQQALQFHHDFIGTEHVLLGLMATKTSVVSAVLHRLGVEPKMIRAEIERLVGAGPVPSRNDQPPRTPRTQQALYLAGVEARALNQSHIGNEHVFLGLLREGGGVAAVVLKNLGVNLQRARTEIIHELGRHQTNP